MATYQHGVYNQEQATSLTTPIRSSAALQVIFGTAPEAVLQLCGVPGRCGLFRRFQKLHPLPEH